jgi:hypothetical protein
MYLKYLWCSSLIKFNPPHCPIDGIVIKKIKKENEFIWTDDKFTDEKYQSVINILKELKNKEESFSEWELRNFNSR